MALISADEVIGCPRCSTEVRLDTSGVKQNSPSWYVLDEPKSHRLTAVQGGLSMTMTRLFTSTLRLALPEK
jgi:hypothetical protein